MAKSSTPRRIPIGPGRWREGNKLVAEVRIGNSRDGEQPRERAEYPLGTDEKILIAWQNRTRADLLEKQPQRAAAGSLAADVAEYLKKLPDGEFKTDMRILLAHWAACPLGFVARHEITRLQIVEQIARWDDKGAAIVTLNHRLRAIRNLYNTLDGIDVPHPTDKIQNKTPPKSEPRAIPMPLVQMILGFIPDRGRAERHGTIPRVSLTKIRLRVLAWTGMPPAQLRRLRVRDVDFRAKKIYLRPRRKGKGSDEAWLDLMDPAVDALRDFAAHDLWGRKWSRSSMRKSLKGAITRAAAHAAQIAHDTGDRTLLDEFARLHPNARPYDLRHSFATEVYRLTGDPNVVKEMLQHASLDTTNRYTRGAVSERVTLAIGKINAAFAAIPPLAPAAAAPKARGKHLRLVRTSA